MGAAGRVVESFDQFFLNSSGPSSHLKQRAVVVRAEADASEQLDKLVKDLGEKVRGGSREWGGFQSGAGGG
jgi:hypothetical protein